VDFNNAVIKLLNPEKYDLLLYPHIFCITLSVCIIDLNLLKIKKMSGRTQQPPLSSLKRKKRTQPPVFNGVTGSYEDKDSDFLW
jgi:hypothetical protein